MGCNYSCLDPDYMNKTLEVCIDDKTYLFSKRPKDLKSLYENITEINDTKLPPIFEYNSDQGIKQITSDLFLHEAYITHSTKKLLIGARTKTPGTHN